MNYYVGIDIGGTNIKYGLVTATGEIIDDSHVKTANNGESIFNEISNIVKQYREQHKVIAVGVSAPGIILDNGFMVTGGSIQDFYGINLKEELEIRLDLPVTVENDANCSALAEKWLGAGRDYHHLLAVVVGTGIGGGIIINDQLFRGGHATAGEFGFMMVEPIVNNDSRMATLSLTGSVGCGVVNKYAEAANLNESNYLNGEEIFALVNQGEDLANQVVADFYDRLAIGIFNMA
ncbi:ROK family protein, partial [Vagococcus salmoninarum]